MLSNKTAVVLYENRQGSLLKNRLIVFILGLQVFWLYIRVSHENNFSNHIDQVLINVNLGYCINPIHYYRCSEANHFTAFDKICITLSSLNTGNVSCPGLK